MDALKEILEKISKTLAEMAERVVKLEKRVEGLEKRESFHQRQKWANLWKEQGGK